MSSNQNEDEDLTSLLDSALADFGKPKNTDDEIDEMMDELDAKAVEKAVKHFDEIMNKNGKSCGASTSRVTPFNACNNTTVVKFLLEFCY